MTRSYQGKKYFEQTWYYLLSWGLLDGMHAHEAINYTHTVIRQKEINNRKYNEGDL